MKQPYNKFITSAILFAAVLSSSASVDMSVASTAIDATTLEVTGMSDATDGTFNYRTFEVTAPEADSYFAEFWVCPARYADGSYTTFRVFVNGKYVGDITPDQGNWQAARVKDCEIVDLDKGVNTISVATRSPECPDVERVNLALTDAGAAISSDAYDEYLQDAVKGMKLKVPGSDSQESSRQSAPPPVQLSKFYPNVPLNYTFFKNFSFKKGQEVVITSQSGTDHSIDVMFYGTKKSSGVILPTATGANPSGESITIPVNPGTPNVKLSQYNPASPDEMQGLNWRGPAELKIKSSTASSLITIYKYGAKVRMKVPQDGMYLIRLRANEDGVISTANLNVNDEYSYDNVPISLGIVEHVTPSDSTSYAARTICKNAGVDDPMIFIHSKIGRLVGFNDDRPSSISDIYPLSAWDAYISMSYHIPTSAISVSSYSSSSPSSTCDIAAGYDWRYVQNAPKRNSRDNRSTGISPAAMQLLRDIQFHYQDRMLTADGISEEIKVCLSDISGRIVFSGSMDNGVCQLHDLPCGMYIVALYDGNMIVRTQKIIIK